MARADTLPDDVQELRRCIRDLAALSALPATWSNYDPQQVAGSIAEALGPMLDSEFVHVSSLGKSDEPPIDVLRIGGRDRPESNHLVRAAIADCLATRAAGGAMVINPLGEGVIEVAVIPVGFDGNTTILVASRQKRFPTEAQRLLLGLGASEIAAALHRWRAETNELGFISLLERSSDFIGSADLSGVPQYVNPAGLALVGLDGGQVRRLHVLDFIVPEERTRVREEVWPLVLRERRWAGEVAFRHFKTGAVIPLLHEWFVIDDPRTGLPINVVTISRDLTARKHWEAELRELNGTLEQRVAERTAELAVSHRKLLTETDERRRADARLHELQIELYHAARLSAAGEMAAALAHEINQPLAAIANSVTAANFLLAKGESGTVQEVMDEAAAQVRRAGQIIRRLRNFVRRGETEKRMESVQTMIEETAAFSLTGSQALGVDVRFSFDPRAASAFADRIQLQQVVANLMRNAVEAMTGQARRELVVSSMLASGGDIEISVADCGPGVQQDVLDHLFEPFVTTKRQGMGLGLSICRSIVEAHGGRLWCEPNPGGGAVFRFTLAGVPAEGGVFVA